MTKLSLAGTIAPADAIVVGTVSVGDSAEVIAPALSAAQRRRITDGLAALKATGKPDEVVLLVLDGLGLVAATGLGQGRGKIGPEQLRRASGAAARALLTTPHVVYALPTSDPEALSAVAMGALLGTYKYQAMKSGKPQALTSRIGLLVHDPSDRILKKSVTNAATVARHVIAARELVDAPPSHLHPADLARAASRIIGSLPVEIEVLDEKALKKGGYGGIIGVGQGSVNPPRLVRLSYRPASPKHHLALVGKGITFDSGGLSIKPANSMETMKSDMAGAAAVLSATAAIAALKIPVSVTSYLACAENMPSGTAQRPSDVLTMYGGKTVEVLNTDAEGRLVMADAIVRAGEDKPDSLVDVATLTGAQLVALGSRVAGVMGNKDEWRDLVHAAAQRSGELSWPMPIPEELRASLDSPIADLANIGERMGGMMTAAAFLREFVPEGLPWAHIDIAGPSFNEGAPWGYTPKGGTGFAVRTLVALAEDLAAKR